MNKDHEHIEQIIREQLADFATNPPDSVWEGIERGLDKPVLFPWPYRIAAAIVAAVLIMGTLWYFNPGKQSENLEMASEQIHDVKPPTSVMDDEPQTTASQSDATQTALSVETTANDSGETEVVSELSQENPSKQTEQLQTETIASTPGNEKLTQTTTATEDNTTQLVFQHNSRQAFSLQELETRPSSLSSDFMQFWMKQNNSLDYKTNNSLLPPAALPQTESSTQISNTTWKLALLVSPEFPLKQYDSITLSTAYTLSVEPSFYFKKHWFVRSGLGFSFNKDDGFAQLDMTRNEMMGTYEDVYDVTFDTIDGNVIPTYHTQTTEIWDSVRHNGLVGVTNRYQYLQLPVLIGYHFGINKFEFSLYGGTAFNFLIGSQIDDVSKHTPQATIHRYQNTLPDRASMHTQLWLGAGVEYRLGYRFSITAEPNFRYQLSPLYSDSDFKQSNQMFAVRFGCIYQLSNKR